MNKKHRTRKSVATAPRRRAPSLVRKVKAGGKGFVQNLRNLLAGVGLVTVVWLVTRLFGG
jgi:hypothetical protein